MSVVPSASPDDPSRLRYVTGMARKPIPIDPPKRPRRKHTIQIDRNLPPPRGPEAKIDPADTVAGIPIPGMQPDRIVKGIHVYTRAEIVDMERYVNQAMLRGMAILSILAYLRQRWPRLSVNYLHKVTTRIRDAWLRETEETRKYTKSEQLQRLFGYLDDARGRKKTRDLPDGTKVITDEWEQKPNHSAIVKYESLIADIQGNRAPIAISVDVRVQEAMTAVVSNLQGSRLERFMMEADADAEAAELARRHGLAPPLLLLPGKNDNAAE